MEKKTCRKCGYQWVPRVENPAECPKCKTYKWRTEDIVTLEQRLLSKIKKNANGCWEWTASKYGKGYGHLRVGKKIVGAHRLSYQLFVGEIGNLCVLHKCDNPACVNPDHLFLGTVQDNSDDMADKGRSTFGEKSGRAKLTEQDVLFIKSQHKIISYRKLADMFGVSSTVANWSGDPEYQEFLSGYVS